MKPLEMYTTTDGREIIADWGDEIRVLKEDDPLIDKMWGWIKNRYPQAAVHLSTLYEITYEKTLRFMKCNFANKDNVPDIVRDEWNLEYVPCPMRGECPDENIICNPTLNCGISLREKQVLKLIAEGKHSKEIGEILCISSQTVDTHRRNMQQRLATTGLAGLVKYAYKHKIIQP